MLRFRPTMSSRSIRWPQLTPRDVEILTALDRCPLTAEQLLRLSSSFAQPFTQDRLVRRRLQVIRNAGWVRRWKYASIASRGGAPDYYKLTLAGFRILYGQDAMPTTRRQFNEIGVAHHHHTRKLADFIVHTAVAAHHRGVSLMNFARENTLRIDIGTEHLFPDCAFDLIVGSGDRFRFHVEIDNGTERVRSQKDVDSWQRKIRLYDAHEQCLIAQGRRSRVLVVSTRSRDRIEHILHVASELVRNPHRSLFYAIHLDDYLTEADALIARCFRDNIGDAIALIPPLEVEQASNPLPVNPKLVAV